MKNKIKEIRTKEEITLEYLSYVSGVSIGYINKLESGKKNNPSYTVMSNIAKALEKQVSEVFFD